jgi:membrane protein YqaA with SNARE-associated domain
MIDALEALGLAFVVVFVVNALPAFMPPTWSLLAFAHLVIGLPALPLAVGGAFAASAGRYVLAKASARYGRRFLSAGKREDLVRLGRWLESRAAWAPAAAVLIYSFGPIPSNQLFVAAGLMRMSLGRIVGAFLAGRLISYPLWIGVAGVAATHIDELFTGHLLNITAVALDVVLVVSLIAFTRVDWMRVIERVSPSARPRS